MAVKHFAYLTAYIRTAYVKIVQINMDAESAKSSQQEEANAFVSQNTIKLSIFLHT